MDLKIKSDFIKLFRSIHAKTAFMNSFEDLLITINIMSNDPIMEFNLKKRSPLHQQLFLLPFIPTRWKLNYITVLRHCITPSWFHHHFGPLTFAHLFNCTPKPMIYGWITKYNLNWSLLIDEDFTLFHFWIFVAFTVHPDSGTFTRCRHVLFCKLILVEDLSFLDSITVNHSNFNATRVITMCLGFCFLPVNNCFWCG